MGRVHVALWSDGLVEAVTGRPPAHPVAERRYLLAALRCVDRVDVVDAPIGPAVRPGPPPLPSEAWVVPPWEDAERAAAACAASGVVCHGLAATELAGFPPFAGEHREAVGAVPTSAAGRRKVVVTGSFDWLHSGHVRFFEEAAGFGDLHVIVGHDANIALLKGPGHPLFPEDERRYMVQAIRFVHRALITSGSGWLDGAPEITQLKPDLYIVNEDGDQPEKRAFCRELGIDYVVLARHPAPGLPPRRSTELRGF